MGRHDAASAWHRLTAWEEPWMHPRHWTAYVEALRADLRAEMKVAARRSIHASMEALGER